MSEADLERLLVWAEENIDGDTSFANDELGRLWVGVPSLIADLREARERVGETADVLARLERAVTHHQHKRTLNDGRATAARELTEARIALDDALEEARARIKELEGKT